MDASLVEVEGVDAIGQVRYRLHDLIRLFARERAEAEDPREARVTAVTRVLGGWLWLLEKVRAVEPSGTIAIRESYGLAVPMDPGAAQAVLAAPHTWFRIEEEPLVAGVELAAAMDLDEAAVELASALCHSAFAAENQFTAWSRTHDAALAVARRRGNAAGQATLLAELGQLRYEQDRYAEAQEYFSQALPMFRAAKDLRGECATLTGMGTVCRERGRLPEALHFLDSAQRMWRDQGDMAALAHVQRLSGSIRLEQGDLDRAWTDLEHALALYRQSGSRRGEALTMRTIALHHMARAEFGEAERPSEQAAQIFGEIGDRLLECYALRTRAKAWLRAGRGATRPGPSLEGVLADRAHPARPVGQGGGAPCAPWESSTSPSGGSTRRNVPQGVGTAVGELGLPLFRARGPCVTWPCCSARNWAPRGGPDNTGRGGRSLECVRLPRVRRTRPVTAPPTTYSYSRVGEPRPRSFGVRSNLSEIEASDECSPLVPYPRARRLAGTHRRWRRPAAY